jgi:hypothetical protein
LCAEAAGLVEHPSADLHDQTGLFGQGDELEGRDQSVARVFPSHECFIGRDLVFLQRHDRLSFSST